MRSGISLPVGGGLSDPSESVSLFRGPLPSEQSDRVSSDGDDVSVVTASDPKPDPFPGIPVPYHSFGWCRHIEDGGTWGRKS
ncbi:MAG: hypothetical protein Kow00105_14650 [Phycisphaeraceae bacterium]